MTTEPSSVTLYSPAKINLFLRILGRRADGYHDLASLFQTVDLCDRLTFSICEEGDDVLTCTDPSVPTDGSNLILKAIDLFRAKTRSDKRFRVHLEKNIPNQAGLGGGSGNAATALVAANWLCGRDEDERRSMDELREWSGEIGSDITFFLSNGVAYCTGRGELIRPLEPLPNPPSTVYIVKPNQGLSTALVYRSLDLSALHPSSPSSLLSLFQSGGVMAAADQGALVNDLEPPAFANYGELRELKGDLEGVFGAGRVMMSGSGTAVFGLDDRDGEGDREAALREIKERRREMGLRIFACHFLDRGGPSQEQASSTTLEWYQPSDPLSWTPTPRELHGLKP
ncbi:unnamed protein product [Vitrella brassicaformis CCMP3155]|uniref:4-(cytidine 5'-diphospho)-2-C-methyl-D-erythritol kinase n=2 Tax=Vitrella brassicaformis TaxID=1169539 RepID=A0A0G4FTM0_VITBC|nr:unnamed protein product [Vitrella brassicaformis CCMP3155]|eukprot:CEM18295.1 unnamed protein product [Vitrella brassicaformis CCMP3155]